MRNKQARLINPRLAFDYLMEAFPSKAYVCRMAERIDKISDLKRTDKDLAAVAADLAIGPLATWLRSNDVTSTLPESRMAILCRMAGHVVDGHFQIFEDRMPELY